QKYSLRHELGQDHTFEIVEGVVPYSLFPGIEGLSSTEEQSFAYYKPHSGPSFRKAIYDLQTYIVAQGPFDGIIVFPQVTLLAATMLLELQDCSANGKGPRLQLLSCEVFFSGRLPYIDDGNTEVQLVIFITNPIARIWGASDDLEPGHSQALTRLCSADDMVTFVHQGGHEIPGSGSPEALSGSVQGMRRVLDVIDQEYPTFL
ncbi:hypothetical protein BDR22DRAFT_815671, partial [Usnea florida]